MKKVLVFICVAILIAFVFVGCSDNTATPKDGGSNATYYNFETDCQVNVANPPFEHYATKGSEGYFLQNDGYFYFADIETQSATILCSKPNCLHNSVYFNTDCNAHTGYQGDITYNEGYIYYLGESSENIVGSDSVQMAGSALMRLATDGSGTREQVYSNGYDTNLWTVHRGYFYNAYREYRLEDELENINRSRLVVEKVPLSGKGEAEILFDSVDFLQDSSFTYLAVFDNYLYYSYQYYNESDELADKLMCYDLVNNTEKEVKVPEGDTNSYEFGISYIYPLGDKLIFRAGREIYRCDLDAENTEKVMTLEDEYHNIFTDGTYLFEDNFANFLHSDLLSIEKADSRQLKVYDSNLNLIDTLNMGNYEMSFRPVDDKYFLAMTQDGKLSCFDKSEIGSIKGGVWEEKTIEIAN